MMPPRTGRRAFAAVVAVLLLTAPTGCSPGGAEAPVGPVTVVVSIVDGAVSPAPTRIEVARGQTVRVTVTSDVADMVHVHGYDRSVTLQPDVAGTVEFVADLDGLYDVETHKQDLQLFQLVVR